MRVGTLSDGICPARDSGGAHAEGRLAALLDLDERVRSMRDPEDVIVAMSSLIGRELGVVRVGYGLMDPTGNIVAVSRDWTAPGHHSIAGVHDLRDFGTFLPEMADGRLVVVRDTRSDPRTDADAFSGIGVGAMVNVPFVEDGHLVAVLFVNASEPRPWPDCDLSFLRLVAGRLHDAVERRRAEAALKGQAAILLDQAAAAAGERDRLWNATRDLMGSCDSDGFVVDVNPAWSRVLGWSQLQIRGTHFSDMVHPDDREATLGEGESVRATGRTENFVNRIVTQAGAYVTVSWNAVCEDGIVHFVGRDITGQLEAEEALRQSHKMEAVGQITGGLAHDFNNILTGLQGAVRLTRKALAKGRPEDCDKYLDMAAESVERGTAIVQRLLAFSRRQSLAPEPTDVGRLVEGIVGLVRTTVGSRIPVAVEIAEGLWSARVDPSQVDNAILNLCINARDAMPDGGRIRIAAGNVAVGPGEVHAPGLAEGHYVALAVSDTGTGMDADTLARAFDPFYTTKPVGVGTGLGLSMVHGFATQSGGTATIQTTPGKGTTVTMLLPRHVP